MYVRRGVGGGIVPGIAGTVEEVLNHLLGSNDIVLQSSDL